MSIRVEDLGTILSVWAHPDDETYLAGALMAEAVASANGWRACRSRRASSAPTTRSPGRRRGSLACGDGRPRRRWPCSA